MSSLTKHHPIIIILHWLIFLLLAANIYFGLSLETLEDGGNTPLPFDIIAAHYSVGLLIGLMVALRVLTRLSTRTPKALPNWQPWEKKLAQLILIVLYACMILLPITGVLKALSDQDAITFFGLFDLPAIDISNRVGRTAGQIHETLIPVLLSASALHIIGALKHQFLDKDNTLYRIIFRKPK
jgi:cytochrome b561